jgi:hypothetical protein
LAKPEAVEISFPEFHGAKIKIQPFADLISFIQLPQL